MPTDWPAGWLDSPTYSRRRRELDLDGHVDGAMACHVDEALKTALHAALVCGLAPPPKGAIAAAKAAPVAAAS